MSLDRYRSVIPEWERFLEHARRPEPTTLRVRTGRIEPGALCARLRDRGFGIERVAGLDPVYRITDEPYSPAQTLEHWLGLFYIQQAVTAVAAPALGARPGERVLDLCAAPGGKTTHLAERLAGGGLVVANEPDEGRIRALLGNVYRLAHANVLVTRSDGRNLPESALFDRVLVDAPCSAEGNLRDREGRLPEPDPGFRERASELQAELLRKAVRLTRPGGVILYVTCTFAPEENEAVVDRVLRDGRVEVAPIDLDLPHAPGLRRFEGRAYHPSLEMAWRLYPQHLDSGGLFLCRLRRRGGRGSGGGRARGSDRDAGGRPRGAEGPGRSSYADEGWGPVPLVFPGRETPAERAMERAEAGRELLVRDLGVPPRALERLSWIQRGKSVWAHEIERWPLAGWGDPPEGGWRLVSVGLRAFKEDPRMGERPTNELLLLLGPTISRGRLELPSGAWDALLKRRRVEWDAVGDGGASPGERPGGLVALVLEGEVVGRGWAA
ncbi:MAG TPA: RsmB/NOP family class I SAM-dependent RNA methyltransferase, partial [Longimicrobiales bacterium]|nr:RsmB/NOP family class I SAM-dependent RNA methyltransferase [Longimicrobiales bacterium]